MITYKSKEEIDIMVKGGAILHKVLQKAREEIKPGMTTMSLNNLIEDKIILDGGEPGFKRVKGYQWASCICINEEIVHTPPSDRVMLDGDVVTVDAGVYYKGLHTDSAFTVCIGTERSEIKVFLETGQRALKKALDTARIGKRIGDISHAFQYEIETAGYSIVYELTGHGVGKDLHEDPFVPCYLDRPIEKTPLLTEGMTLALEVMYAMGKGNILHAKDGWSITTADKSIAACFEHSIGLINNRTLILT